MLKQKKLLMIADADSFWTKRYVEHLLLPAGYQVVLFPIWGNHHVNDDFFKQNDVTVYEDTHTLPLVRHIPRLRIWARIAQNAHALEYLGPFDVVHNHYLSWRDLALGARLVKHFHAHWVCSFWGSDIMRANERALAKMKPYLERCNAISVHNEQNRDQLRRAYGESIVKKTTLLYFGQTGFAAIDQLRRKHDKAACKAHFGIEASSFTVCVGSSASSAQQQLSVLESIGTIPVEQLQSMALILQQTYGENSPDYARRVREYAFTLPCKTVVLTTFMDATESAFLRLAADVFVHAIITDAFSASMQEYLYAGACVLKGTWLHYPQLTDMGIALESFDDFADIPALLNRAMSGALAGLSPQQQALFPALYSWNAVREKWLSLYC